MITPDGLPAHITTEPCDEFTHEDDYKLTEHLHQGRSKLRSNRQKRTPLSDPSQLPKAFVDCIPTTKLKKGFDEYDARKMSIKAELTRGGDTFVKVCKRMKLDFGQHNLYRQWLVKERHVLASDLPESIMRQGQTLKPDLVVPYPSGEGLNITKVKGSRRKLRSMHADIPLDEGAVAAAGHWVHKELKSQDNKLIT